MPEMIPFVGLVAPRALRHFFGGYDQHALYCPTIIAQLVNGRQGDDCFVNRGPYPKTDPKPHPI